MDNKKMSQERAGRDYGNEVTAKDGNVIRFSARNFGEFRDLLDLAEKQSRDLAETLEKLSFFEVAIKINTTSEVQ